MIHNYRAKSAKYCSKECWSHRNPPSVKICGWCGITFTTTDRRAKFCSRICAGKYRSKYLRGDKSGHWKGGTSLHRDRAVLGNGLALWRGAVFKRDNYTCQICGYIGKHLQAHHVKPFSEFPELRTNVDNGITVCHSCHEVTHGRAINTPSQFPKHCIDCGSTTSGRAYYCRSCGTRHSWENRHASS